MQRFTNWKVRQRGHALVLSVHRMTTGFPLKERYGLTSQLGRPALSVLTNFAEGPKRLTNQECTRFLNLSTAPEKEYLLLVSCPVMAYKAFIEISELSCMLHGLRKKVEVAGTRTGARTH
jgi:four helix bundle protein